MENLVKKLAHRIAQALDYDSEKEAVVAYGLFAMILTSITFLLIGIIGIIVGTLVESLIVFLSVSILRKYSGGAHASTSERCTLIGVVFCTAAALLSRYVLFPIYDIWLMLTAVILIYLFSYWIIYKRAPVDSPNKPISDKKKIRMKKGSLIVLSVYLLLSIAGMLLGHAYPHFKAYGISLLFGVCWQILTLVVPIFKLHNK